MQRPECIKISHSPSPPRHQIHIQIKRTHLGSSRLHLIRAWVWIYSLHYPGSGSSKYRNGLFFTKWTKWSFVLRNGAFFPHFCNFYSVFMISIISDCRNNIKYDFAVLESYFIHNSLCEISDEMEFYFTKWSMIFPFLQLLFCFYDLYHI